MQNSFASVTREELESLIPEGMGGTLEPVKGWFFNTRSWWYSKPVTNRESGIKYEHAHIYVRIEAMSKMNEIDNCLEHGLDYMLCIAPTTLADREVRRDALKHHLVRAIKQKDIEKGHFPPEFGAMMDGIFEKAVELNVDAIEADTRFRFWGC